MDAEVDVYKHKVEVVVKKDYINVLRNNEPKFGVLFTDFMLAMMAKRAMRNGEESIANYTTILNHIHKFCELYGAVIYTNSVNEEFLYDFIKYMKDANARQSYIKYSLTLIKGMARKAGIYGYAVDISYDDVDLKDEEPFAVYLTMNEITRLYFYKGLTRFQERVRDLFIVGCLTGMRYSDYSTITTDNVYDGRITKITKKTGKKVVVPIHDYVKDILDKYNGDICFGLCNQHFNRYIKLVCEKVGFDDIINYSYTKGGKVVNTRKYKWEMISSHTARRSAATGMILAGCKFYEVMAVTGHTTEKSLARYIKVTNEEVAKQMSGGRFFTK
jgi:integrase